MTQPALHRVTGSDALYFYGYYERTPWDATGRYLLAHRTQTPVASLRGGEVAQVGTIDLADGDRFTPLDETTAWCWQMGAMLQWHPLHADRQIIYNQRHGDALGAVIRDLRNGSIRRLPRPIFTVSPRGDCAISLNYSRLDLVRPGYGYAGHGLTEAELHPSPADDGLWRVDLATGEGRLIYSLREAAELAPVDSMRGAIHWFNIPWIGPSGDRLFFLHRWRQPASPEYSFVTRFMTIGTDGSRPHILGTGFISHTNWQTPERIVAFMDHPRLGRTCTLLTDRTDHAEPYAPGIFHGDGHMSFSPDGRWLLTDTMMRTEAGLRDLLLYDPHSARLHTLATLGTAPGDRRDIRTDLHPRWNRTGDAICIDSSHEGARAMYTLDVTPIVTATGRKFGGGA